MSSVSASTPRRFDRFRGLGRVAHRRGRLRCVPASYRQAAMMFTPSTQHHSVLVKDDHDEPNNRCRAFVMTSQFVEDRLFASSLAPWTRALLAALNPQAPGDADRTVCIRILARYERAYAPPTQPRIVKVQWQGEMMNPLDVATNVVMTTVGYANPTVASPGCFATTVELPGLQPGSQQTGTLRIWLLKGAFDKKSQDVRQCMFELPLTARDAETSTVFVSVAEGPLPSYALSDFWQTVHRDLLQALLTLEMAPQAGASSSSAAPEPAPQAPAETAAGRFSRLMEAADLPHEHTADLKEVMESE